MSSEIRWDAVARSPCARARPTPGSLVNTRLNRSPCARARPLAALKALCCAVLSIAPGAATAQSSSGTPAVTEAERAQLAADLAADASATAGPASAQAAAAAPPALMEALAGLQPDIAVIGSVAAAAFTDRAPLLAGGHDPARTGWNLPGIEIHVGSAVDPYLRYELAVVFLEGGLELEEGYATTQALPAQLQLRAGKFGLPFGRQNGQHLHAWTFFDQPMVWSRAFGPDGARGLGAELSRIETALPWYLEHRLAVTHPGGDCCGRSFPGADQAPITAWDDLLYTAAQRHFFALGEDWGLSLGLSAQTGGNAAPGSPWLAGGELYLRWRPVADADRSFVALQAEWLYRHRTGVGEASGDLADHGGYAQLAWGLSGRWQIAARTEYGSGNAGDPLDPDWTEGRTRHSVVAAWLPSEFSRIRLQGSVDQPQWADEPVWGVMLGLETSIGAHAAHPW